MRLMRLISRLSHLIMFKQIMFFITIWKLEKAFLYLSLLSTWFMCWLCSLQPKMGEQCSSWRLSPWELSFYFVSDPNIVMTEHTQTPYPYNNSPWEIASEITLSPWTISLNALCILCVIRQEHVAADSYYALEAVGLWRWVIGQIVRGFPQSAGHIKQAAVYS